MLSFDDFRNDDGNVNWSAYHKAREEAGETCYECGEYISRPDGSSTRCWECKNVPKPEELIHSHFVRCPQCGTTFDPYNSEQYKLFEDGEHTASCQSCYHDFEISTSVSYTFTSPPLKDELTDPGD